MSSCSSSKHKAEIIPNEKTIEKVLDDETESSKPAFDPTVPITVPFETVAMGNREVGYKIPQFYVPYLLDENYPMSGMTAILDITDEYQVLSGCNSVNLDGTTTYCSFEGSVGIYYPYWFLLGLDREQCDEKELQLIAKVENLIEEVYYNQTKTNIKK